MMYLRPQNIKLGLLSSSSRCSFAENILLACFGIENRILTLLRYRTCSTAPPSQSKSSLVLSMTRPCRLLPDVVNIHHQYPPALLCRLGNTTRQSTVSWNRSEIQHFYCSSSAIASRYTVESFKARSVSRVPVLPFLSGARFITHFGEADFHRPSQHSKKDLRILKASISLLPQKQSSTSSWITVIIVAIVSGAVFHSTSPRTQKQAQDSEEQVEIKSIIIAPDIMTGKPLPGRPGTLTPHEEEKLKEFWTAILQVFEVLDLKDINGNGHADPLREKSDSKLDKKAKKKRLFPFRSKNKDDDATSMTSTESGSLSAEDDKYGQTKEFHEALANLSPEMLRNTFWSMVKHDHPDGLLLRFLRARKWDVEKALVMMVSTMRWRSSDMHVDDDIMLNGELKALEDAQGSDPAKKKLGEDFLEQMRLGKSFLHGTDKEGRPMCFVRVRLHRQGEQSEESLERYTVFVIESARMLLLPNVDTAVSSQTTSAEILC